MRKKVRRLLFLFIITISASALSSCDSKEYTNENLYNFYTSSKNIGFSGNYSDFKNFICCFNEDTVDLIAGVDEPMPLIGSENSIYFNSTSFDVYFKKSSWELIGNLKNNTKYCSTLETTFLYGANNPTDVEGSYRNIYINAKTWDVFEKDLSKWNLAQNIKGLVCSEINNLDSKICSFGVADIYKETHPTYKGSNERFFEDVLNFKLGCRAKKTINFITNDEIFETLTVDYGSHLEKPKLNKDGYVLDGWYLNDQIFNFETEVIKDDISLTGTWLKLSNFLRINELCSKNRYSYIDSYGEDSDWIEIYNSSQYEVNLNNYAISNGDVNYVFGEISILPNDYLVLVASGRSNNSSKEIHLPFTLSQPKGGKIILYDSEGYEVNRIKYPGLKDDVSYGYLNGNLATLIPSPNSENIEEHIEKEILRIPTFSIRSGIFSEEFDLQLTTDQNADIYYTLDCSDPTESSLLYNGSAIHIYDKSFEENLISSRTDICAKKTPYVPLDPIEKCMIVKACCIDEKGNHSKVVSATYFINQGDYLNNISIVSLSTDFKNLFDYNEGIYCNGKVYDDYCNGESYDSSAAYYNMPANFTQRGYEWERLGDLTYIDSNHEVKCEQRVGIRIHGNHTRGYSKKSFCLYSRYNYDKNNNFTYKFFGYKCNEMNIRSGGNNEDFPVTDYFNSLAAKSIGLNFDVQNVEPTYLFLNGEFWGLYFITESFNDKYYEEHCDAVDPIIIKDAVVDNGFSEDRTYFTHYYYDLKKLDMTVDENYLEFLTCVDEESFVDYMIYQSYLSTMDFSLWSNCIMWLDRMENKKIHFSLYDTDFGGGNYYNFDVNPFTVKDYTSRFDLLLVLLKREEFKNKYMSRLSTVCDKLETFITSKMFIDVQNNLVNPLVKNGYRYFGKDTLSTIKTKINKHNLFFEKRESYLINYTSDFSFYGES